MRSAGAADRASGLEEDTGWMGRNHPWLEYNSGEMQEGLFGNVSKGRGWSEKRSLREEPLPGVGSASIVRAQFGLVANYLRRKCR